MSRKAIVVDRELHVVGEVLVEQAGEDDAEGHTGDRHHFADDARREGREGKPGNDDDDSYINVVQLPIFFSDILEVAAPGALLDHGKPYDSHRPPSRVEAGLRLFLLASLCCSQTYTRMILRMMAP
jgi:hypothetical protein